MRQFEGAPASNQMIEQSKLLLERTGFFKSVNVETVPVAGEEDQVDVIFDVEEQNYGNIVGGFGYSQFGFSFNFNVQQQNFLGSGNTVGIGTQISDYSKISFFNMKILTIQLMGQAEATQSILENLIIHHSVSLITILQVIVPQ